MRTLRLTKLLLLTIGIIYHENSVAQADFKFLYNRNNEQLSFKKVRGLMVIQAIINNKGPFNLILDTGIGIFLITDPALCDSLKIQYIKKIKISGLGEKPDVDAYVTPALNVKLGNTIAEQLPAAIFGEDVFNLSAYAGIPIHGLIGYDFFISFRVHIFYENEIINLYTDGTKKISKKYHKVPLTIENNKPYCLLNVETPTIKKQFLKMLIDTGAGHAVALETYKEAPFPLPDEHIPANLGVGLNGNIGGFLGRLKSINLGKFLFSNPICAFPNYADVASKTYSIPRNGSIGNLLLKKFNVIFDYQNNLMYIKPNINYKSTFEHDMSGLELFASGENFDRIFVNRVEPNSPADNIGIKKNDELININFKKVKDLNLEEIIQLLQSQNNKNLYIEYMRNDILIRDIITLKRRI